ncbi:MAG: ABC transporter permease subunit [Pseudomonadota bacterium]
MSRENYAFVRTEDAPTLAPPPSQVGITGWLWQNVFRSMANYSTVQASIQSGAMVILTAVIFYLGITGIWKILDFSVFQAVWTDPEGQKRAVCATIQQGGALPNDWYGACWPFVTAKWKLFVYGRFPEPELWRPNLVFAGLAFGITWLVAGSIPRRRLVGAIVLAMAAGLAFVYQTMIGVPFYERIGVWLLVIIGGILLAAPTEVGGRIVGLLSLTVLPVAAFILLTGGHLEVSSGFWFGWLPATAALIGFGLAGQRGMLGAAGEALGGTAFSLGVVLAFICGAVFLATIDFGMPVVETAEWGGLLVTLVVALTGIVASLPLGVLLALGRRSSLPAVRLLSTVFIEFWRGVPLITVLFMSSVMLPLFLPEGTEFNKLLRALIGVALFSAAYMAEVIRGGLQAIPKGQYEGAMALGLPFWRMMNLIVLPQALVLVIPGIVNTFIGLFKDTTLVLIIGLFDLLGSIQSSFTDPTWSTPVQSMTGYILAATIFFLFCFGMSRYSMYMEQKLRRGHSR